MAIDKDIRNIGQILIKQAQDILKLNGAFKTGKLLNSFKITVTDSPMITKIQISNNTPYAIFIDKGTLAWKNGKQQKEPVTRKYEAVPGGSGYPFNKKGIEPIYFMDSIERTLPKLEAIIGTIYTQKTQTQLLADIKKTLLK